MRNIYRSMQNITPSFCSFLQPPYTKIQMLIFRLHACICIYGSLTSNTIHFLFCSDLLLTLHHASFLRVCSHIYFSLSPVSRHFYICNCHNFAFHCTVLYCHLYSRKALKYQITKSAVPIFNFQSARQRIILRLQVMCYYASTSRLQITTGVVKVRIYALNGAVQQGTIMEDRIILTAAPF